MSVGINEFYEKYLGKKLRTQYAWGALMDNSVLALNCWSEEISVKDNQTRVLVLDKANINRMSNGHINPNYQEREQHIDFVKAGVKAYGVLISNGGACPKAEKWNIKDLNTDSIFELSDLQNEDGILTMAINLTSPVPVAEMTFDEVSALNEIKTYPKGLATVERARTKGWTLIGLSNDASMLTQNTMLMDVELKSGKFKTYKKNVKRITYNVKRVAQTMRLKSVYYFF
jgi:hypothetical protein